TWPQRKPRRLRPRPLHFEAKCGVATVPPHFHGRGMGATFCHMPIARPTRYGSVVGNSAHVFFDNMEIMMMTPTGNRWNVFVLESGDFVWVGAADTREEAMKLLEDNRDNRGVEYGFLAEMEVFEFFGTESERDTSALQPDELAVS